MKNPSSAPLRLRVSAFNSDLAGMILAGGEGRRWGGPKAFARLPDGRTFLEACASTLGASGASPVVATLPPGSPDPQIANLEAIALEEAGLDMFGSLLVGLGRLVESPDWQVVTVLPVDHPLVGPDAVSALASTESCAVIPSFNGKHGHPVCLARSVVAAIVEGKLIGPTLREILRSVDAIDVPVDDPGVITNCNTPEALATALERLRSEHFES
jgi:CTP:molybdopterin cytidylyltransferase MocA